MIGSNDWDTSRWLLSFGWLATGFGLVFLTATLSERLFKEPY